jgi:hypothetical protein
MRQRLAQDERADRGYREGCATLPARSALPTRALHAVVTWWNEASVVRGVRRS